MNKLAQIAVIIMWFFIIVGAIIVTKMCLWGVNQSDTTSIILGYGLMFVTWLVVVVEFIRTRKKFFK